MTHLSRTSHDCHVHIISDSRARSDKILSDKDHHGCRRMVGTATLAIFIEQNFVGPRNTAMVNYHLFQK